MNEQFLAGSAPVRTWKENFEQWKITGGDRAYHYLGSAIWFNWIGKAMGDAMKTLLPK